MKFEFKTQYVFIPTILYKNLLVTKMHNGILLLENSLSVHVQGRVKTYMKYVQPY